jgi:hypothetical protein
MSLLLGGLKAGRGWLVPFDLLMVEDGLKQELAAIYRKRWMEVNEKRVRVIEMPEDEYLAKREKHWQESDAVHKRIFPFDRDAILKLKRVLKPETPEFIDRMVTEQVEQAFPFLLENRQLSGVTGPVTVLEARIASMTHQVFGPKNMVDMLRRGWTEDLAPERRAWIKDWLDSEELKQTEVDALRRNPTQENFDQFHKAQEARAIEEFERREGKRE